MDRERKCSILDGKFLNPCWKLFKCNSTGTTVSGTGLHFCTEVSFKGPSFSFMLLKSGEFRKQGVKLNFCPFCGTDISEPFTEEPK